MRALLALLVVTATTMFMFLVIAFLETMMPSWQATALVALANLTFAVIAGSLCIESTDRVETPGPSLWS